MDFLSVFRFLLISFWEICLFGINVDKLYYLDKCLLIYMGLFVFCLLFIIFFIMFIKVRKRWNCILFK